MSNQVSLDVVVIVVGLDGAPELAVGVVELGARVEHSALEPERERALLGTQSPAL